MLKKTRDVIDDAIVFLYLLLSQGGFMKINTDYFVNQAKDLIKTNQSEAVQPNQASKQIKEQANHVLADLIAKHKQLYGAQSNLTELQIRKMGLEDLLELTKTGMNQLSSFDLRVKVSQIVDRSQFGGRKVIAEDVRHNLESLLKGNVGEFREHMSTLLEETNQAILTQVEHLQQLSVSQQNLLSLNLVSSNDAQMFVASVETSNSNLFRQVHVPRTISSTLFR
jgi:hypothetical protein